MRVNAAEIRKRFERQVLPELDLLYTVAFYLTGNASRASEVCQEMALRAYESFPRLPAPANYRPWLLTILFGIIRESDRQAPGACNKTPAGAFGKGAGPRQGAGPPTGHYDGFPTTARPDCAEVPGLLRALAPEHRAPLLLVDLAQLTYEEAALVLDVPLETVRTSIACARTLMRCRMRG